MKEYQINVYNVNTNEIIDTFISEFTSVQELYEFMENEKHNYNESYYDLYYDFTLL